MGQHFLIKITKKEKNIYVLEKITAKCTYHITNFKTLGHQKKIKDAF